MTGLPWSSIVGTDDKLDVSALQKNLEYLASAIPDAGGSTPTFRWGTTTLTFTASTDSGAITVSHGLGRVPVAVFAMSVNGAFGHVPNCNWASPTTSTFLFAGEVKTAFTGTATVNWLAIG